MTVLSEIGQIRYALVLTVVLTPLAANAVSGTVYGRLLFYNFQGNYCPTSRDCTGAKYLQSSYQTNLGVSDSKVYLKNMSNVVIGQGTTDATGNYVINWFDPSAGSGWVQAYVVWNLEHKDGRFAVHDPGGNNYQFTTPPTWVSTTNLGNYFFGNSSFPNTLANLYNGAWRGWKDSLSQSSRLVANFTNVDIRAFDSAACSTSCANCTNNRIIMDNNSAFQPQARILHEMGHIASCRASDGAGYQQAWGVYCYPGTGINGCFWDLDSPEWGAATFEEAYATFFGDAALYGPNATQPHTCLSSGPCPTGAFNIEASGGLTCGVDTNRRPINNVRYFWDLYDSVVDFTGETTNLSVGAIADGISYLPNGYDNNAKNEPFFGLTLDDNDGRSSEDYRARMQAVSGLNTVTVLANNCGALGD